MLDIGWTEFFVIGVLALIVVGPKDLPAALRAVTKVIRRARGLAREFQSGIDEMMREAELDDIRKEMNAVRNFDPADAVKKEADPSGTLTEDFDPARFNRELMERVEGKGTRPRDASGDTVSRDASTGPDDGTGETAPTNTKDPDTKDPDTKDPNTRVAGTEDRTADTDAPPSTASGRP